MKPSEEITRMLNGKQQIFVLNLSELFPFPHLAGRPPQKSCFPLTFFSFLTDVTGDHIQYLGCWVFGVCCRLHVRSIFFCPSNEFTNHFYFGSWNLNVQLDQSFWRYSCTNLDILQQLSQWLGFSKNHSPFFFPLRRDSDIYWSKLLKVAILL